MIVKSMFHRLRQKKSKCIVLLFSTINEQNDKSSTVTLFAEDMTDLGADEKKPETTKSKYFN